MFFAIVAWEGDCPNFAGKVFLGSGNKMQSGAVFFAMATLFPAVGGGVVVLMLLAPLLFLLRLLPALLLLVRVPACPLSPMPPPRQQEEEASAQGLCPPPGDLGGGELGGWLVNCLVGWGWEVVA